MAHGIVRQDRRLKPLTRRRFLELSTLMGGVAVLAACSTPGAPQVPAKSEPTATAAPAQAAPAAAKPTDAPVAASAPAKPAAPAPAGAGETPVPGGAFRIAFAGAPDFIDPFKTFQSEGYVVSGHIFDNLTTLDPDNRPLPMLATRWTPDKNAQEWVFDLREGVKFHHGKELTADDVVATLQFSQDPKNGLRTVGAFGPFKDVKAEGKYKVRIILTQPFADLPIAAAGAQSRIVPADKIATIGTEPVGSGPFKLKDIQQGSLAVLVKNPDYWMKGQPYLDELRVVTIKEATARMAALQSGSIEAIWETSAVIHQQLEKVPTVKVFSIETGGHHLIQMQANMEPFTKPEVRNAFKLLLDRDPLVKSLLLGLGTVGNDHPLPQSNPFWSDRPPTKRDLEKAKAMLAQAGVPQINLELWTSSERPPSEKLAVAFKEQAAPAGINVEVKDVPQAVYSAEVSKKKPLYTVNRLGRATLYEQVFLWFHGTAGFNYSGVTLSTKLDRLLEDMIAETDEAKRKAIVGQVIDEIMAVGHHVIPYFINYTSAQSSKVQGYAPSRNQWVDVRNTWIKA